MAAMNGLALAARIGAHSPATPVILMTGDPSLLRGGVAAEVGARHLLSKHLKLDELIQKIREVLQPH
jgi:DNA-binding NtrC family response regulator